MHLVDRIERRAQSAGDRLAHVSGGRTLTYRELVRRSDALAARLAELLPRDTSPVVVLGHKEPEMLIGFLAAIKSGHPYVPVDTVVPPQRVERIVKTAGAGLTLTPEKVAELSQGARRRRKSGSLPPIPTTSCSLRAAPANPRESSSLSAAWQASSIGCWGSSPLKKAKCS